MPAVPAIIGAGALIGSAAIGSRSQGQTAKRQTDAAIEAARIEDEAAKRAEAWARQQAQQKWIEAEAVRRANYDQWASRQRALNAFRAKYGYGAVDIPSYTPSQDPGYTSTGTSLPAEPSESAGGIGGRMRAQQAQLRTQAQGLNRPIPMGAVDAYLPSHGPAYQPYEVDWESPVQLRRGRPRIMSVDGYLR